MRRSVVARIRALAPDFLFSFYYRQMLTAALLAIPARGALNMHGSLLPRYRGRAPVNWAVLHGERETGRDAALHGGQARRRRHRRADGRADPAGRHRARGVRQGDRRRRDARSIASLPALLAGTAPRMPLDLARGSYFGGRKPEDGRIDWSQDATRIHNLVRAVAPPYPGAFTDVGGVERACCARACWTLRGARSNRAALVRSTAPPASRSAAAAERCSVKEVEVDGRPCERTRRSRRCSAARDVPL